MSGTVEKEWLSVGEVQKVLGIGSTKAYELVQTGKLPAIRVGRALRVHRRDIDAWAERNRYIETAISRQTSRPGGQAGPTKVRQEDSNEWLREKQ